jgi:anti-anti-sigma factor
MGPSAEGAPGPLLVVEQAHGRIRVILTGSLDLANVQTVGAQLRAVMSRHRPRTLTLDMTRVDFCDCSSLQMLIDVRRDGELAGTRVVIPAGSPAVVRLLRLFALDGLFGYPTTGPTTGESIG